MQGVIRSKSFLGGIKGRDLIRSGNSYHLLTGCKGHTRKYKPKVFHTARACEGCLENQGLVFLVRHEHPVSK